jgi:hypothetical protein
MSHFCVTNFTFSAHHLHIYPTESHRLTIAYCFLTLHTHIWTDVAVQTPSVEVERHQNWEFFCIFDDRLHITYRLHMIYAHTVRLCVIQTSLFVFKWLASFITFSLLHCTTVLLWPAETRLDIPGQYEEKKSKGSKMRNQSSQKNKGQKNQKISRKFVSKCNKWTTVERSER